MTIKTTILTFTAAAMIAGSAFSMASAASRDLGDSPLPDGYTNSDGTRYVQHSAGYGYSTNKAVVSKLSDSNFDNGSRGRDLGEAAPISGYNN